MLEFIKIGQAPSRGREYVPRRGREKRIRTTHLKMRIDVYKSIRPIHVYPLIRKDIVSSMAQRTKGLPFWEQKRFLGEQTRTNTVPLFAPLAATRHRIKATLRIAGSSPYF